MLQLDTWRLTNLRCPLLGFCSPLSLPVSRSVLTLFVFALLPTLPGWLVDHFLRQDFEFLLSWFLKQKFLASLQLNLDILADFISELKVCVLPGLVYEARINLFKWSRCRETFRMVEEPLEGVFGQVAIKVGSVWD